MKIAVPVLALILFASAASAQPAAGGIERALVTSSGDAAEARSEAGGESAERPVCRRVPTTGTRHGRRVCMTPRQWRDFYRNQ